MPDWSSVKLFLSRRLVAGRLPLNPLRNTGRHLTETVWPVLFVVVFPWPNHFDDQRGKSLLIKIQKPKLIMKKTGCRIEFSRYRVRTTHTVGLAPWIDAAAGLRSFLNAAHFSNRVQVIGRTNGKCQMIQSRLHTHICFLVFLSPLTAGAGLNWQYQWLVRFVGHSIDALLTKSISVVKKYVGDGEWADSVMIRRMEKENGIPLEPVRLFVLPKKFQSTSSYNRLPARARDLTFRVWAAYSILPSSLPNENDEIWHEP